MNKNLQKSRNFMNNMSQDEDNLSKITEYL